MSIQLMTTFVVAAEKLARNGDIDGAIIAMGNATCCRDVPKKYLNDAERVIDALLTEYYRRVHL